mgnify:CR=1 FL=1
MNNFIYENSTKVYFGQGCVKEFLSSLMRDSKNVLLASGIRSAKQNGVYDEVLHILMEDEKNVVDFSGITPNPTYGKVLEGIQLVKEKDIDLILGIGGGSVMDCAKAVSLGARCAGNPWENYWERKGIVDFAPVPVGVIPTTAGTGSECNGAAVITNEKIRVKIGYDYAKCNPVFALMDPTYTFSVPREQLASGAFDSLSHIMETYFSQPDEENVSDEISEALMRCVIRNTRRALKDPGDYTARSNLMWVSTLSENRLIKLGKRGDFGCHLIEHQLGAYTGCNHGQGMAVLQPVYYRHIYKDGLKKFAGFAVNVWGIPAEGRSEEVLAEEGIKRLSDFIREIGLPETLRELGVRDKRLLKKIAASSHYSMGGYRKLDSREILEILNECF